MTLPFFNIDKRWTLFLDRDGVINQKRDNDYVKNWEEFIFLEGAKESIATFNNFFGRVIIVTNQRGVGRKLMTNEDVELIHQQMLSRLHENGGAIDKIYFCPDLEEEDFRGWRKPKPGMAFAAKEEFPEIKFDLSVIIGDSISDMQFGRNAGMHTIWVSQQKINPEHKPLIDAQISSLKQYSELLLSEKRQEV